MNNLENMQYKFKHTKCNVLQLYVKHVQYNLENMKYKFKHTKCNVLQLYVKHVQYKHETGVLEVRGM